jgi:hypothetical protein
MILFTKIKFTQAKPIIYLSAIVFLLSSCNLIDKNQGESPIARVGEKYLFAKDIIDEIPEGLSYEDSLAMVNLITDNWVNEILMIQKAELNLGNELINFEKQLEKYRKTLLIYTYENQYIIQNLDTNITEEEILKYYNENIDDFELKDNIVRVNYIITNLSTPNLDKVSKWFKSSKEEDIKRMKDFCRKYALQCFESDSSWISFTEFKTKVPIESFNDELLLKSKRFVEFSDTAMAYFVEFKDYKIKETSSPLMFEKDKIKSILLNRRKVDLLRKLREGIYQEALERGELEYYLPN